MGNFELMLARRLGWKPEGRRRVSPAVAVAVAGVALSVVVMLLSVAVMLGFKDEVSTRLFSLNDAITIRAYTPEGEPRPFDPAEVLAVIDLPAGANTAGHVHTDGILKTDNDFMGVRFDSSPDIAADSVINITETLAAKLTLKPGDRVPAYFVVNGRMRVRMLSVGAVTPDSGIAGQDEALVRCSAALPGQLLDLTDGHVLSLGIRDLPPEQVEPLAADIYSAMLGAYYAGKISGAYGVETIYQTDGSFFSWLELLDTNVIVILSLMGAVAAFTIISSLFIIILERVRTIGLLKAMGATNRQVRTVFMLMAERLVIRGLLLGNAIGLGLTAVQQFTHAIPLDSEAYLVDFVPVKLSLTGIMLLNAAALLLSWLVLMLPAMLVSRISPAATMRYE